LEVEDFHMNTMRPIIAPLTIVSAVSALLASPALADIYLEVDFAGSSPNGLTEGNLVIFDETPLSVWMWSDEPDTGLIGMTMEINGLSFLGNPNSGGDLQFDGIGTVDPDNHFNAVTTPGMLSNANQITNITFLNLFIIPEFLPTSRDNAWLIYTDFTGTAIEAGSGVTAILSDYQLTPGSVTDQEIISYGLYQTPTPNTTTLFALAALSATKRRR
jgi:hypothetical protein